MNKKHTYIDIFAGCGGLSLGLNQSGWKGLFAIEKSPYAFSTLKYNLIEKLDHFDWPDWLELKNHDINSVISANKKNLLSLRNKVDLVAGGPPCQGFSTAGMRMEKDKRNNLIKSYVQFIRLTQPKLIFFENVKGFTQKFDKNKSKGIRYSEYVKKALRRSGKNFSGYNVYGELVDFSDFGIPQKRTRFILIGIRKDSKLNEHTKPEHFFSKLKANSFQFLKDKKLNKNPTLTDAISDLLNINGTIPCPDSLGFKAGIYEHPTSKYQICLRSGNSDVKSPDSHRMTNHNKSTINLFLDLLQSAPKGKRIDGENRIKYNIKKRSLTVLDGNKPSPTITSHPDDYIHYSEPRILTVRECARIQSFPDWFKFREKYTTGGKLRKIEVPRYTQVGNAIPPLFGEQTGLTLNQLLNG